MTRSLLLLLLFSSTFIATGAEYRAQVLQASSSLPIEGVLVRAASQPTPSQLELTVPTGPFGFFTFPNLPDGNYNFTFLHPGFATNTVAITLPAPPDQPRVFQLAPLAQGNFDLYVQVLGAVGGLQLDAIPVRIEQYAASGAGTPVDTRVGMTDTNGFLVVRGVAPGFYQFHANHPADGMTALRWLPFSSSAVKPQLLKSHSANIQLKPDDQDLTVIVRGFDPAKPPNGLPDQPLANIYVELTGLHPGDHDQVLVAARTGITDFEGKVTFHDLAPFHWRVRTKRMGYQPTEEILQPDPNIGGLLAPNSEKTINVQLSGTKLITEIDSIYRNRDIFDPFFFTDIGKFHDGIPVVLTGYPHSNTDGIRRTNLVAFNADRSEPLVEFENILPGRYRVQALPKLLTAPSNAPSIQVLGRLDFDLNPTFRFNGSATVELDDGKTNELQLTVKPQPAIVRGRLFVADGISDEVQPLPGNSAEERLGEPIYRLRAQTGIEFRDMDIFSNLLPDEFVVTTDADAGGEFMVELPPGVFGVKIPGMTNHLGVRSVFSRKGVLGDQLLGEQGWPYIDIAQILSPPNDQEARGFPLNSGEEYQLDLYVNRHAANYLGSLNILNNEPTLACVTAIIAPPGSSTTPVTVPYSDLLMAGTARATPVGGTTNDAITGRLFRSPVSGDLKIGVRELPRGAYDIELLHPRYTSNPLRFTTPDWRAPGVLPPQTAGITPFQTPALATFGATGATTSGTFDVSFATQPVMIDVFEWLEVLENGTNVMKYVQVTDDAAASGYFTVGYAPGLLFHGNLRFQSGLPFQFWIEFLVSDGSGGSVLKYFRRSSSSQFTYDIFINGPQNNVAVTPPSAPGFPLTIRARSSEEKTMFVPGTSITLESMVGNSLQSIPYPTDQTIPSHRGRIAAQAVQNTNGWTLDNDKSVEIIPGNKNTGEPTILTVFLRRQLDVHGTVVNATNASHKIGGAGVILYNRFGRRLAAVNTDTNGVFVFTNAVPVAQTVFVGVDAPGFKPVRKRFADNFTDQPGMPLRLDADLTVEALRPPTLIPASMDLNRAGLFLPGVTRAGNASALNIFNATNALTLRWAYQATIPQIEYTLDAFDDANGPAGMVTNVIQDQLARAWFIDARSFPGDPLTTNAPPDNFQINTNGNSPELRAQLRELIRSTNAPFFRRSENSTNIATRMQEIDIATTNSLSIPDLPPGTIRPFFALTTRRGAVTAREFAYTGAFAGKHLKGLRVPPWMAAVADVIGFTAGLQGLPNTDAKKDALKAVMPEGLLVPLPAFKAEIKTDTNGFLSYKYEMEVSIKDGEDSPSEGLAALGLGKLGIEAKGKLNVELDGPNDTLKLSASAEATNPDGIEVTEYLPRILPQRVRQKLAPKAKARVNVNGSFEIEDTIGDDSLTEKLVIQSKHGGFLGLEVAFDMKPYATKVPYVGPVLLLVDQVYSTNFVIDAKVDGGIGAGRNIVWTTDYPRTFENPPPDMTVDPGLVVDDSRKVLRRHFLGGTEENNVTQTNTVGLTNFICFTVGVGFDVKAGSLAGASGRLGLTGTNCPIANAPTATLELNQLGSWPVVRRISGSMEAQFKAFLNVWIRKYEKEYKWNFMPFDYQFGTDPFFMLVPLDIGFTSIDPLAFPSANFQAMSPTVLTNLFPAAAIAATEAGNGAIVFADTLSGGQGMAVRVTLRNPDGTHAAPVTLGTAGGVMNVQIVPLSSGEWMVAWVEMDLAEMNNPFPPTRIRSVVSSQTGSVWTMPVTVASQTDAVSELRLVSSPMFTGAAWFHTSDGPGAILQSLTTATWNGATWSAPNAVLTTQPVADLIAVASPVAAAGLLCYRHLDGRSVSRTWTASSVTAETVILATTTRLFDLTSDPSGNYIAAVSSADRDLTLFQLATTSNAWSQVGAPLPFSPVDNLVLQTTNPNRLQLAWIPRLARHQIWTTELNALGQTVRPFVLHNQQPDGTEVTLQSIDFATPSFLVRRADTNGVSVVRLPGLPPSATQILLHPQSLTGTGFEFLVTGPQGLGARAQSSAGLDVWSDLIAFDIGTNAVQILDPMATNSTRRFYRVIQELP